MKSLAAVVILVLAACGNLAEKRSGDYTSLVKVAVVNSRGTDDTHLQVHNGNANSVGIIVPFFIFSESRYRKCGTGRIDVEGHLRELPPSGKTDISLRGLFQSNNYVGIFVYANGSSDHGDHCLVWSENRMS
jgi:hypothetical protein